MIGAADFLPIVQLHLCADGIQMCLKEEFNALNVSHRQEIRADALQSLAIKIPMESLRPESKVFFAEKIPQFPGFSLSISHCEVLGGWAAAPLPYQIGLDIESSARINKKNLARASVANDHPFPEGTSESLIWCAKEAAFKSLDPNTQPAFFGKIQIQNWFLVSENFYRFSAEIGAIQGENSITGIAHWSPTVTIALAIQVSRGKTQS